jgi:hypothetical protein
MPRPRVLGYIRKQPRVYSYSEESVEAWLRDKVWIERKVKGTGTEDGTPIFTTQTYGPYAGRLAIPVNRETFATDRFELASDASLTVASDIAPMERDEVLVKHKNVTTRWRIEGSVDPRESAWGHVAVYQVDVTKVTEY